MQQRIKRYTKIQEDLDAIKKLTGIDIVGGHCPRKDIAAELKLVHDSKVFDSYTGLVTLVDGLQKHMLKVTDALDTALRPFNEIQKNIKITAKELGVTDY